ncbi:MAG: hypothetical protein QOG92_722, partial [Verrucomicrobiota bacterium]|nr:hypothetical protein [Verrucomicrobiota bacterium]
MSDQGVSINNAFRPVKSVDPTSN